MSDTGLTKAEMASIFEPSPMERLLARLPPSSTEAAVLAILADYIDASACIHVNDAAEAFQGLRDRLQDALDLHGASAAELAMVIRGLAR